MPQLMTSWGLIYPALRGAFPDANYPPGSLPGCFSQTDRGVAATFEGAGELTADILVGADGSGSLVRQKLMPEVSPRYAGYVAWRGVVPESSASELLSKTFVDRFTFQQMKRRIHPPPTHGSQHRQGAAYALALGRALQEFPDDVDLALKEWEADQLALGRDLERSGRTLGTALNFPIPDLNHLKKMNIKIYSDLICPWCYIGKRRMQAGLKLLGKEIAPRTVWRPFQLNPDELRRIERRR